MCSFKVNPMLHDSIITSSIISIVSDILDLNDIDTKLELDSITAINLVVRLEEHFDIIFLDEELLIDNFSSIKLIEELVINKISLNMTCTNEI